MIQGLLQKKKDINFGIKTSQLQTPKYILYQDEEIVSVANAGKLSMELYHRLIRGTIHCMNAISSAPPFQRYPTSAELEEMAKSLIVEYPHLKDEETGTCKASWCTFTFCMDLFLIVIIFKSCVIFLAKMFI